MKKNPQLPAANKTHSGSSTRPGDTKQALPAPPRPRRAELSQAMPQTPCSSFAAQLPRGARASSESPGGAGEPLTRRARVGMGMLGTQANSRSVCRAPMTAQRLMNEHEWAHSFHKDMETLCCLPPLCNQYFTTGN